MVYVYASHNWVILCSVLLNSGFGNSEKDWIGDTGVSCTMCQHCFLCAKFGNCRPSHTPSSIFSSHSSACISRLRLIITHNVSHSLSADVFGSTPSLSAPLIFSSFLLFFFLCRLSAGQLYRGSCTLRSLFLEQQLCVNLEQLHCCRQCRLEEQGNCTLVHNLRTLEVQLPPVRTLLKVSAEHPILSLLVLTKGKYSASLAALWTTWRWCSGLHCNLAPRMSSLCGASMFSLFLSLVLFRFSVFRQQSKNINMKSVGNSKLSGDVFVRANVFFVSTWPCHVVK